MANPYDDVVASYAGGAPAPASDEANPYDAVVADIATQQQTRARTVYEKSLASNPDQAAESVRLAKQTGLAPDVVERNLDEVRRKEQARQLDLQRLAAESPVLARQLADAGFTKQAHDDLGVLEQVEQFFRNTGSAAKAGVFNASKGAAGVFRAGFELVAPVLDPLESVTAIGGNPLRRLAEGFTMQADAAGATAKAAAPKTEGNIAAGYYSGIQSLTQNLLALPMAFAPGGQGAALGMMSATTGGQSYQDARTQGLSMSQALPFAASQAAIEYATEKLPLGQLIGDVKAGTAFFKTLAKQVALEVPGEQVATILQDMNEWAVLPENKDKPFSAYIAERPDAAAQTLVATIVGTGGNVTVVKGMQAAVDKLTGTANEVGLAETGADQLQAALQTATQSKLRERNPEQFRALMQQMVENTDGAPQEIYLDAEVLNQLPQDVLQALPETVLAQMADALAANDVVSIPVADVLTVAPGTALEQALIENARIGDPMAMTQAEAKVAGEQAQQYLAQEAERVIAQANDAQALQASSDRVKQGLVEQLNTAGRFSPAVNEAYATWTTAFYTTMAGRLGISPEEMAAKYPLRIGAQGADDSVLLGQGATLADVTAQWDAAGIKNAVSERNGTITLSQIVVPQEARGAGQGSAAMQALVDYADRTGQRVVLSPSSDFGGSKKRLVEFYKRFGFVENKGRNKDFTTMESMIRAPQTLAQSTPQTETPEFKNWFGDSKVVDESGKPLVVYHGTGSDIAEFNTSGGKGKTHGTGAFFSTSTDIAATYSTGESPSVYPTYLSLKNPVVIDGKGANWSRLGKKVRLDAPAIVVADQDEALMAELEGREPDPNASVKKKKIGTSLGRLFADEFQYGDETFSTDDLARWARKQGYDGVIFKNVMDHGPSGRFATDEKLSDVYVAFSPTQIKSAIGNRGTFDPNGPNILNQSARATFNPQTLELVLNENADLSSFLHETGHFFLEVMADLSSQPDAPAEIQQDMAALLKWFGIKGDENVGGPDAGGELAQKIDQTETPEFKNWFGDSKVVDESGKPLVVYHGTRNDFTVFDYDRIGDQGRAEGAGFYFTTDKTVASGYGAPMETYLSIKKPLPYDAKGFNQGTVAKIVRRVAELEAEADGMDISDGFLSNFGDTYSDGVDRVVREAARLIAADETALDQLSGIVGSGVNPEHVNRATRDVTGFDGVVSKGFSNAGDEANTIYVAFFPEQIKSATGNSGAFDPNNPSILAQDGSLPTDDTQPVRRTPLETWNAMTLDQKRKYHERFAESFEQYLIEGKAPSLELQPLFRKFKRWMENVYTSLKAFIARHPDSGMVLSPEIRQVFGRMLATREQIAQAEEVAGMVPNEDATEAAVEKLTARSLRDLKWTVNARAREIKKLQKQAAELRKGVEAEVRAEVEQQPIYRAMRWLKKGETTNEAGEQIKAEKGFRLNTGALTEMFPETTLARPNLDRLKGMTGKDGLHPDMVADMFGFDSGEALVRSLIDAEPIASVIEGMTDQRMLERHGDLVDDRAIAEAANEAVHNEARARALATELKAQADALGARADTGETNAAGSKVTVSVIAEAAKQFAANVVARTPIRDLKSRAWQHVAAERRAGKRWQEATAKGKTQEAIKAKQDQVLNNAAAKAAGEAQVEMRKILDFFKRVVKDNNEKTVEKGRDPDVVNAARAVLAAYGVAPRAGKSALEYMEVLQKNDPAMFNALQPAVQAALNTAQPLDALTMDELRNLHDEIQGMWYMAKRSRQMEVDGNLMDLEETADLLHARMTEIGIPDEIPGERGSITEAEERGIKLQFAKSILRRVEQWSESLDGKFGGPFLRFVFQPIKAAADRYRADKVKYRERLTELVKGIADKMPPGKIVAPELGYTFGNGKDSGTAELLHALLHTGNDSNKRKLLLGRQWATENPDGTLDTARWDAFLQRMHDSGTITKAHWDFAQGVWDLLEEMKPLAQKTHRDVYGRYFAEVTANPVATPFGEYRGGYVPAQTDSRLVKDAKLRELAEGENDSMAYAFPASPSGFTKARVEYNQPLLLDLRALGQHMDKVLLFSHMQGAVTDVRRLLTRKNVSYGLNRIDPGAYEAMLIPWLNRAAKQIVETPVAGDRKLSRFLSAARSRAGMALMFGNVSNTLQQITGFSLAAVKVKPGLLMKASAQFVAHPKQMRTAVADASTFMKNRMLNEVSAMNDAVEQILVNPSLLERSQAWTQRHAYFLQTAMANTMEPIVWTAAYNQAVEQGMSEHEAIKFADGTIRQTQGSTLPEDISRFESGPAYGRLFTQFVGYFNMMANTNATAAKQIADDLGLKKGAGKLLYVALAGMLAPIWVAETIAVAMRGGPGDEDDDGYLDDWLAAVFGIGTLRGMVAQVPIVGQAAQMVASRFNDNPADDKFSLSPAVSLIESSVGAPASVYKAIMEDGSAMKATKDVAAAATMITGLPIFAIARPVGYAVGVAEGRVEPTSAVDAVRGAVSGTASKESKQP